MSKENRTTKVLRVEKGYGAKKIATEFIRKTGPLLPFIT